MSVFSKDPLQITCFTSYATEKNLIIQGRALEDEKINLNTKSFWNLVFNTWKRFESDEIKNTPLKIDIENKEEYFTSTDKNGYFKIEVSYDNVRESNKQWLSYEASFLAKFKNKINNSNRFKGEILLPNKTSTYGIISDIDDTILYTGVVSKLKWKLLVNTFFRSPLKRIALENATLLFQTLQKGTKDKADNPVFYVSNSPWNLYRYLELFLNTHNFPKGPILLRSMQKVFKKSTFYDSHKYTTISHIIKSYPDLKFILIGDAGEYDAKIYIDMVKKYPDQVDSIFIKSVPHPKKMKALKTYISHFSDIPLHVFDKYSEVLNIIKDNKL